MLAPRLIASLLPGLLASGAPLASPLPEPGALSVHEAAALREAILGLDLRGLDGVDHELVLDATWVHDPTLSSEERSHLEASLRRDLPTAQAARELLDLRLRWRSREAERFVFWWQPGLRDPAGLPARPPAGPEIDALDAVHEAACRYLGVDPLDRLPYHVDPRLGIARTFPREDLRWGVWAPDSQARGAVVQALARERGGVPGLWEPLGLLLGTCHEDPSCRLAALDRAERVVASTRPVGLLELLTAGHIGGAEDPAHASALLLVDLVVRQHGPEGMRALLDGLRPGRSAEEARRVVWAALDRSPRSLDRRLERWLQDSRRDRLGR